MDPSLPDPSTRLSELGEEARRAPPRAGSPTGWLKTGDARANASPRRSLRLLTVRLGQGFSARQGLRGSYRGGTGTMPWPPWGPEGGSPMPPHVSALQSLRPGRAKNPHPHPALCSPPTAPRPALGLLHRKKTGDGEAGGGRGARGCAAASPGSLITSACSAPAPSSQLPSNTREFNSSINRREALHFGERWRGWVGLGGGSHDSTRKQTGNGRARVCGAPGPRGPAPSGLGMGRAGGSPARRKGTLKVVPILLASPSSAWVPQKCSP